LMLLVCTHAPDASRTGLPAESTRLGVTPAYAVAAPNKAADADNLASRELFISYSREIKKIVVARDWIQFGFKTKRDFRSIAHTAFDHHQKTERAVFAS
jgi:hypothetical protein